MTLLRCPAHLIHETLEHLREGGRLGVERVVFWLADRSETGTAMITEVHIPQQEAAEDYFRIPREGMTALMTHLRRGRQALRAQVHSHPGEAFHSHADDTWAVVRHEGGLSIVVPSFAANVTAANFFDAAAVFRLASDDRWVAMTGDELAAALDIVP
jgi:hypothetical protein